MALIKCEECGKEISDKAISCPNCGCPISEIRNESEVTDKKYCAKCGAILIRERKEETDKRKLAVLIVGIVAVILIIGGSLFYLDRYSGNNSGSENTPVDISVEATDYIISYCPMEKAYGKLELVGIEDAWWVTDRLTITNKKGEIIENYQMERLSVESSDESDIFPYGFAFTSFELDDAVMSLNELLPDLIRLAQIEKSCELMSAEIEKTRRRVNSLEHVMIPRYEETIKYISMKLEENDRSSRTRLMKVKDMLLDKAHNYSGK